MVTPDGATMQFEWLQVVSSYLAGDESTRWNRLTDRMSLITQRLIEQGFVYDSEAQVVIDFGGGCNI